MRSRVRVLSLALIALVILPTAALGLSAGIAVSDTVTIEAADGPRVDVVTTGGDLLLDGPDGPHTVEVTHDDGSAVFESDGPSEATVATGDLEGATTAVSSIDATNNLTINPADKQSITVGSGMDSIEFEAMTVETSDTSSNAFSYDASQITSLTVTNLSYSGPVIAYDSASDTVVGGGTVDQSGNVTFDSMSLGTYDSVGLYAASSPTLSDPSPTGATITSTNIQLEANLSDDDFGTSWGESVTLEWSLNGQVVSTTTATSAGVQTTTVSGAQAGSNSWSVTATDQSGLTASTSGSFAGPDQIEVRNESNPDELIDQNAKLDATFFIGQDEQMVIRRNVTNGTVDFSGIPTGEPVLVSVRDSETNFTSRRILIEDLTTTSRIYLLPASEPSAEVVFDVEDQTGEFGAGSVLTVEKPVTRGGSTSYEKISADRIGPDGILSTFVVPEARYRITIENTQGDKRVLGSYQVTGATRVTLPIGDVVLRGDGESGGIVQSSYREAPDSAPHPYEIKTNYVDRSNSTSELQLEIVLEDGTVLRPNTTETGPFGEYSETTPVDAGWDPTNQTAEVRVAAQRDGETENFVRPVGDTTDVFDDDRLSNDVLELVGWVSLMSIIGLLVIVNPAVAAIVGVGFASLLTIVGIIEIPAAAIALAGSVAVLFAAGNSTGRI